MHRLCIELFVINWGTIDWPGHIDNNITAATGSVCQQVFVIARPNEGGVTTHLLRSRTVWTADIDNRFLKNMLQKSLLIHSVLVKFVHIDQCEPIEGYLGIPFVTEINAVRVICL